jgi:hypothetical protein
VPARLADAWVQQDAGLAAPGQRGHRQGAGAAGRTLARWELVPTGTEGYRKAEVTLGGVDTRDLSSRTMESKQPGLYFIGEVVDVTGWLGGYNFQWAWASGHACAQALRGAARPSPRQRADRPRSRYNVRLCWQKPRRPIPLQCGAHRVTASGPDLPGHPSFCTFWKSSPNDHHPR